MHFKDLLIFYIKYFFLFLVIIQFASCCKLQITNKKMNENKIEKSELSKFYNEISKEIKENKSDKKTIISKLENKHFLFSTNECLEALNTLSKSKSNYQNNFLYKYFFINLKKNQLELKLKIDVHELLEIIINNFDLTLANDIIKTILTYTYDSIVLEENRYQTFNKKFLRNGNFIFLKMNYENIISTNDINQFINDNEIIKEDNKYEFKINKIKNSLKNSYFGISYHTKNSLKAIYKTICCKNLDLNNDWICCGNFFNSSYVKKFIIRIIFQIIFQLWLYIYFFILKNYLDSTLHVLLLMIYSILTFIKNLFFYNQGLNDITDYGNALMLLMQDINFIFSFKTQVGVIKKLIILKNLKSNLINNTKSDL